MAPVAGWKVKKPITGIADCWARAASGQAVAPAISDMNSRLLIAAPQKAEDKALFELH